MCIRFGNCSIVPCRLKGLAYLSVMLAFACLPAELNHADDFLHIATWLLCLFLCMISWFCM